jgi:hypothetical protein
MSKPKWLAKAKAEQLRLVARCRSQQGAAGSVPKTLDSKDACPLYPSGVNGSLVSTQRAARDLAAQRERVEFSDREFPPRKGTPFVTIEAHQLGCEGVKTFDKCQMFAALIHAKNSLRDFARPLVHLSTSPNVLILLKSVDELTRSRWLDPRLFIAKQHLAGVADAKEINVRLGKSPRGFEPRRICVRAGDKASQPLDVSLARRV